MADDLNFQTGVKAYDDYTLFKFDFRINDKRFRSTYKVSTEHEPRTRKRMARDAFDDFIDQKEKELELGVSMDATFGDYWEKVKISKSHSWNDKRTKRYKSVYAERLKDTVGSIKLKSLQSFHFNKINDGIKHLSQRSQKEIYEVVIPVIERAIDDGVIDRRPFKKDHVPKRNYSQEKKVVHDAKTKYKQIHAAIHKLYADNPHQRAIYLFGFHGRRLNEVLTLQWTDINFKENTYTVRAENSKIGEDLTFTLPLEIKSALSDFIDIRGNVFHSKDIAKQYQKFRDETGIEEFTFHWMRNLAVSALQNVDGMTMADLSAMLGHKDLATLKKYLTTQNKESTAKTNTASESLLNSKESKV